MAPAPNRTDVPAAHRFAQAALVLGALAGGFFLIAIVQHGEPAWALLLAVGLLPLPAVLAWPRERMRRVLAALGGVLMLAVSVAIAAGGGVVFLPSALLLLIAAIAPARWSGPRATLVGAGALFVAFWVLFALGWALDCATRDPDFTVFFEDAATAAQSERVARLTSGVSTSSAGGEGRHEFSTDLPDARRARLIERIRRSPGVDHVQSRPLSCL